MKKIMILAMVAIFAFSACGESKPSKASVVDAMMIKIEKSSEADKASKTEVEFAKKLFKCAIESSYKDLSKKSLDSIVDEKVALINLNKKLSDDQNDIIDKAMNKCAQ